MNQKELGNMLIKMGEALLNDRERDSEVQCAAVSWDYVDIFRDVGDGSTEYCGAIDLQVRLHRTDWHPEDGAAKLARIAGVDAKGAILGGKLVSAWEYPRTETIAEVRWPSVGANSELKLTDAEAKAAAEANLLAIWTQRGPLRR